MLHFRALSANPAQDEADVKKRRDSRVGLSTERRPTRAIAGGSDGEGWDQTGRVSSRPPM
jgi:hypothetical protein